MPWQRISRLATPSGRRPCGDSHPEHVRAIDCWAPTPPKKPPVCGFFTEVDSPDPMAQHWPTVAVFFSVAALGENIGLASRLRFAHRSPLIPSQRRSWGGPPVVSIGWEVPSLRGHRLSAAGVEHKRRKPPQAALIDELDMAWARRWRSGCLRSRSSRSVA